MQQEQEPFAACDVSQIPEPQVTWTKGPSGNDMVQVRELLQLIDKSRLDGPIIVSNFLFWRVQPCKERVHPMFEYSGGNDSTRESSEIMTGAELNKRLEVLLNMTGYQIKRNAPKAYQLTYPPPQV